MHGEFRMHFLGKANSESTTLPIFFLNLCAVFSSSRNQPNSDMDYRIFNVCTWSFLCVRTHTGGWTHQQRVSSTFWLGKAVTNICFLCSGRGSNRLSLDLYSQCSTNWTTPVTPNQQKMQSGAWIPTESAITDHSFHISFKTVHNGKSEAMAS